MQNQLSIINHFCKNAKFFKIKYDIKDNIEFGKILTKEELPKINLERNEIHRSIYNKNNDLIFIHNLQDTNLQYRDNPLQSLKKNLNDAQCIEKVYPNIFNWFYNGLDIIAMSIIPNTRNVQSSLRRYGGVEMFYRILNQHLENIRKMHRGLTPDYNFLNNNQDIPETILSTGSINSINDMFCVPININESYISILKKSKNNIQEPYILNMLNIKYWTREINPDFIVEAKHIKLKESIPLTDEIFKKYPPCINNIMNLKTKGNYNRFLLARFLLAIHKPTDAKFIYDSVMSGEEKEHLKTGDCATQWTFILNNMKRYDCPTCRQLKKFCTLSCKLSHPLEKLQEEIK